MIATRRTVIISVNPHAGRGTRHHQVLKLCEMLLAKEFDAQVLTNLQAVTDASAIAQREGTLRCVLAAGGDGTVAELVNRLPPGVPITVLPLGTENLLAKYLGIGTSPAAVARVVGEGSLITLDAGMARCAAQPGEPVGTLQRIFVLMASCGLDAEVVHRLHQARRGSISHWSYLKPIVSSLRNYRYPELRVSCLPGPSDAIVATNRPPCHSARWMFVFNLPCYAWGLKFTPQASGLDGRLDLCSLRRGAIWHGLRYLGAVLGRQLSDLADCVTGQIENVRVEAEEPVPCQLDGDPAGFLPLEISVLPRRLTLLAPREWAKERNLDTVE